MTTGIHNSLVKNISVLDLCPYWTWPTTGGGPERVHNLNKVTSQFVDITQVSVRPTIGHQNGGLKNWIGNRSFQHTPRYLEEQYFSFFILAACYLLYKTGKHSDTYLSSLLEIFGSGSIKKLIRKSDVIQVEHPWLFDYAKRNSNGRPIIFVAHNVESNLWDKPVKNTSTFLRKNFIRSSRELEEIAARNANAIVCMSPQDANCFIDLYNVDPQKVAVIPNGADFSTFENITLERKLEAKRKLGLEGKFVILFAGSDHYPNKEALKLIQNWEAEVGRELNAKFVVIGTVGRNAQSTEHMRVEGFVNFIEDYFLAADIALNPLLSGSGTSLKIVDYLCYKLPTITTEVGIRGLELKDGFDVLLSDTSSFPGQIRILHNNHSLMSSLGQNGAETVQKHYSWEDLGKRMVSIYQKVKQ